MPEKVRILNHESIVTRLRRMAYEVYEANYGIDRLIIIGISERGGFLARMLSDYLREISEIAIDLINVELDRESDPVSYGIDLSEDFSVLEGQHLVVVDDVLYTGRTMLSIVAILLQAGPKQIQTAVLIDRGHRLFPISSDVVGIELATTLPQHIYVEIDEQQEKVEAFLL